MEYYSELGLTNGHHSGDSYVSEYSPQYMIPSPNAEYAVRNSILVDGGDRFGVSAVVFDKYEELIWMGNQGGHVTSYYGPTMQKYTSFQIHESEEVRDIITLEHGIYCLTKSTLRHQIRRGIPKFTHRSHNMIDMQCLFEVSPTKLFLGGHQDKLVELDLNKMMESVIPIEEAGCAVLRSGGGSVVACGSASGMVSLRDVRAPMTAQHTFSAHAACLSDLDMQGNLLITCGFTQSSTGAAVPEQYVVVWDVRCLRRAGPRGPASRGPGPRGPGPRGSGSRGSGSRGSGSGAWSVATASPPLLLHFLPAFSGRAVALSGDGHVALLHLNSQEHNSSSVFQVDTHNSQCSVMDVSSTSQALVFGDQAGHLNLFSPQHNHEPVFNNFSRETEFASQGEGLPFASFTDTKFQYSSVPVPRLATDNKWFNELPAEFYKKSYRKPKPIDPEVLKTMKMQGPIGYAPNPRTHRRNQMPYLEESNAPKPNDKKYVSPPIPNEYRKNASASKNSSSEDLNTSNNSGLPGLESSLPNSYCNAMLQVLFYTSPVKATLLAHTCAKEYCLSCELGILFRTLSSSGGDGCAANKFLRSFRTVPEAAALGLILPDRPTDTTLDFTALIQSWNRFILHQIHYEILESRKKALVMFSKTANSPPQYRSVYMTKVAGEVLSTPRMNGHYNEDFQYTDLEFLGPSTEIDQECEIIMNKECWQPCTQPLTEGKSQSESGELNHRQDENEETEISKLFAIGRTQLNRCLKCNKEEERSSVVLACALQAAGEGGGAGGAGAAAEAGGATELLRGALAPRRATPAWCDACARFTPTTQRARLVRLPPILAINCGGVTAHEKTFWTKGSQKEMLDGMKRSGKPCRYGLHCARPGCRFKHPDRPGTAGSRQSIESQCALPLQLLIRLQADGDVTIIDKADPNTSEPTTPVRGDKTKKKPSTLTEKEYCLSAAVISVEDNPRNLVAYIQTGHKDGEPQWHLFNDLRVTPVSMSEVCSLSPWWKSPCVLFYSSSIATNYITSEPTAS